MSKMKEINIMVMNATEPLHRRLLVAQKDILKLKNAAYANHRLMEKMDVRITNLAKLVTRLTTIVKTMDEDDNK